MSDERLSSGTDEVVAMARVFAVTNTTEQKDVEFFLEQLAHCADRDERHQWVRSFRNQMIGVGAGLVISDVAQAEQEPIGWRWKYKNREAMSWQYDSRKPKFVDEAAMICEPFYAAPQSPANAYASTDREGK